MPSRRQKRSAKLTQTDLIYCLTKVGRENNSFDQELGLATCGGSSRYPPFVAKRRNGLFQRAVDGLIATTVQTGRGQAA
ncbi:MAG: hypothetical protein HOV83_15925 [Catenulispora sp.]|nr:hypothetical protein [Catenulispora sp.]